MNFDFRDLRIRTQAYIIFGTLALVAVINFFVINTFRLNVQRESEKIDVAGKTRMLSQRIALLANRVHDGEEHLRAQLRDQMDRQDNIFKTFEFGGKLPGYDAMIEPFQGMERSGLTRVLETWHSYRQNLQVFISGSIGTDTDSVALEAENFQIGNSRQEAFDLINQMHDAMLNDCQHLVQVLIIENNQKKARIRNALIIFLVIDILTLVLVLFLVIRYLFEPLRDVGTAAVRISSGDLDARSDYAFKNELGEISGTLNGLVVNLKNATSFVQKIGEGSLDEQLKGTDEDEVNKNSLEGALLTMRDQMKQVQQEEKERKWSTEGLTRFVDILRSNESDVHELGNRIISELVDYTNSNQGGLYLLNDEDEYNQHLELVALYAFDTRKYDEKTIRPGEGLVGQTFLERKTTYLLEIPHEYITIVSGLGGANPKAILIVPLMVNEEIYGIIELASFNEYQPYEIEFVEKLGESIASTISGVKTNQQTKILLEESQSMTEQMQAQEEEMRQNMEELTATQEEMARTEKELYAQQSAINSNIGIAEFSEEGLLINVNAPYASGLGYSVDELKDMPFSRIAAESGLWQGIVEGAVKKGWYAKTKSSGEQLEMQSSFAVVASQDETRIIELVTEFEKPEMEESDHELSDVEAMLRQQMEELEITQEQLNQKVKFADDRLRAVNAVFSFILCSPDGTIADANEKATQALGLERSRLVGSAVQDIFDKAELQAGSQTLVTGSGKSIEANVQHLQQDGATGMIAIIWT